MLTLVVLVALLLWSIGTGVTIVSAWRAPAGFENEHGFYAIEALRDITNPGLKNGAVR